VPTIVARLPPHLTAASAGAATATTPQNITPTARAVVNLFDTEEVAVLINALPPEEADKRHITTS
jgi:hypothetical protein